MGFVLLIVAVLVAWFLISAMNRAKTRMAYADQREAMRELEEMEGKPHLHPSWYSNVGRLREFLHGSARLAERRGVPLEFTQDAVTIAFFHYIALLERKGSSFTAQQIAGADYLENQWFLAPLDKQTECLSAQLNRTLGK